jgi:2-succinyl-6-hydroxy-2,4-cyclohexadiene-1-carboxylate synthase
VPETVVLLHGFGGTHRTWDGVIERLDPERYRPLAIDLPGHGEASSYPPPITFEGCVQHVLEQAPERFVLCGYSMGGRVALHVALTAPERVFRLVLISCDPGIEDPEERARRRAADERLACELEEGSFEEFIERWRTQPLFADDPPEVRALARADQRRNDPLALAAAMRGLSVGGMSPLWGRLSELRMPVSFLAGERDVKYTGIGERMASVVSGCELAIVGRGHPLPLENPGGVADSLSAGRPVGDS